MRLFAAGVRGGAGPGGFRTGIEAARRVLGNRAFVRWVEALDAGGQVGAATARSVCDPVRSATAAPVTDCGPLQLMPKKKKQQPEPAPDKQQPEPVAAPVEEKKKKSRVQVALNTLRGEGVGGVSLVILRRR